MLSYSSVSIITENLKCYICFTDYNRYDWGKKSGHVTLTTEVASYDVSVHYFQ